MTEIDRGSQKTVLLVGFGFLAFSLYYLFYWLKYGVPQLFWKGTLYTGWVAGFVIISFCVLGFGFVLTALRNLGHLR